MRNVFFLVAFCWTTTSSAQLIWDKTNGLDSIGIIHLVYGNGSIYAGTTAGVYKSTNDGSSWEKIPGAFQNAQIASLSIKGSIIFLGTTANELFLSTDAGATWKNVWLGQEELQSSFISKTNTLYVGTGDQLHRSSDMGITWMSASTVDSVKTTRGAIDSLGYIYCGSPNSLGLYWSLDHGKSFQKLPDDFGKIYEITVDPNGVVYILTSNKFGLYRTTNNGLSWAAVSTIYSQKLSNLVFTSDGILLAIHSGAAAVGVSLDSGSTWGYNNVGMGGKHVRSLCINDKGYLFAGTSESGVYKARAPITTHVTNSAGTTAPALALSQNPCGADGTLVIFTIRAPSIVTLLLVDVSGSDVQYLVDEFKQPGTYTIPVVTERLSSGAYLCILRSGEGVSQRSLLVRK